VIDLGRILAASYRGVMAESLGFWIESDDGNGDPNDNTCEVGVNGAEFRASGGVSGVGTDGQLVRVVYDTPQPTHASRSNTKVSVKQSKYSTLNILFDGVSTTGGPVVVEKCSVRGSANTTRLTGSVSTKCKTDSLFSLLDPAEVASIQAAFDDNRQVKVKVNSDASKGSISIRCKGEASVE